MSSSSNNHGSANDHHHQHVQQSPSHIAMTEHDFSPEDLQDLLGGVLGDPHPGSSDAHSLGASDLGDDKVVARTERKRSREKQRRCDVNKQFTELTAALRRIEAEAEELRAPTLYSPHNRADLIARTVSLLKTLHDSNKRRKQEVGILQDELQQAKKAGEETAAKLKESMMSPQSMGGNKMLMMVPMMIGGDGAATPAMGWGGQGGAGSMPFMMPSAEQPRSANAVYSQAPTLAAAGAPDQHASVSAAQQQQLMNQPWGMMPPWMMQHMVMPPSMMGGGGNNGTPTNTTDSSTASTSSALANGDQKAASDNSVPVGSNLAHCA